MSEQLTSHTSQLDSYAALNRRKQESRTSLLDRHAHLHFTSTKVATKVKSKKHQPKKSREGKATKEKSTTTLLKKKPSQKPSSAAAKPSQKPAAVYKPSQLAKGTAKNEYSQSLKQVAAGQEQYANNPNNKPAQINKEKADKGLLFSQKLATCCNKSNIPMNYKTYDNVQTNGNGFWGGFSVPDVALRPIAKSKLFGYEDGSKTAEYQLATAINKINFLELPSTTDGLGMLIRHFAHRQFIEGRDDLLRMMTRKKKCITITDIVLTNASGENLLGAKNKHEIYRCIHGEDGTTGSKKTNSMTAISDALVNIAFKTVEAKGLIVNNTQIFVRRPIKTNDALGLTEAGRFVFDFDEKGKRLTSDSESFVEAPTKKRTADKITAKPSAVEPTKAKKKKKAEKPATKPPAVVPVTREMAAKLEAAVAATSSDGEVGTKELDEASAVGYSKAYIIAQAADAAKKNT